MKRLITKELKYIPSLFFQRFVHTTQLYEAIPSTPLLGTLAQIFCNDYSPFTSICASFLYSAGGFSPDQLNTVVTLDLFILGTIILY